MILDEYIKRELKSDPVESSIEGGVKIEIGSKIIRGEIRGPCVIGKDSLVENSFVVPYTSVGAGSQVVNSRIEYCVLMKNSVIKDIERLEESLVGRNSTISHNLKSHSGKATIGDYYVVEV